ncbi:hypothetical protein ACHAQJ_000777 [Trichoderma viride]
MGFGNFLDGLKTASHWALNNCGTALSVVKALSSALQASVAADEAIPGFLTDEIIAAHAQQTDEEKLAGFHSNFDYVSHQLAEKARKAVPNATSGKGRTTKTVSDNMVGLWKNPNGLDPDGHPAKEMYQDLSVTLAAMGVPSTVQLGDNTVDTVIQLGGTLFSNTGPNALAIAANSGNPIQGPVKYDVQFADGSHLGAAHVYYAVPMGMSGVAHSLHSAIHLSYTTSGSNARAYAEEQKAYITSEKLQAKDGWIVTLNLTWASGVTAKKSQSSFRALFSDRYKQFDIVTSNIQGTLQLLKVQTGADDTAAAVRAAVQDAAQRAVNPQMDKSDDKTALKTAEGSVEVKVTNTSWLTAKAIEAEESKPSE